MQPKIYLPFTLSPWLNSLARTRACVMVGGFAPHTNVTLHGLSNARFNDCAGVVMGYIADSGRHIVKLASGKTLKVLPMSAHLSALV